MNGHPFWSNGSIHPASTSIARADDQGLLLGDGLFETLVARERRPLFLERHLRRLRRGIDALEIVGTSDDEAIRRGIDELVESSGLVDSRVRITITPGPGPSPRERGDSPLTMITIAPLAPAPSSVALCTVDWIRNERSPLAGIKSSSWGDNAMILRHATAKGFDNAILCDSTGRLSECTTSNVFLVIDGEILTPSLDSGCLPGIIREVLIESGTAIERDLHPSDLHDATEVFITSSTTDVVPVARIDEIDFDVDGPFTLLARSVIAAG